VEEHLAAGEDVLLEIDVQGALAVRRQFPEAVLVFLRPPSPEELRRRLLSRPSAASEDIDARLAAAEAEEAQAGAFDEGRGERRLGYGGRSAGWYPAARR
jgi:guanylate kinase